MSGNFEGPSADYAQACPPYNPTAPTNAFDFFCPGIGHGWLANECYTDGTISYNCFTATWWILFGDVIGWGVVEPIMFYILSFFALPITSETVRRKKHKVFVPDEDESAKYE